MSEFFEDLGGYMGDGSDIEEAMADSYTADKLNNPDRILEATVSSNDNFVTFDYIVNGERKFKTLDQQTLMVIFELQDDREKDPYHYVPVKKRIKHD